jgi:hypothetical protein
MIIVNKLYRKNFNQYSKDDWKYIFSIYTLRDKYNFTEEAFLSLELTGKITMLKKMDESLYVWGEFDDAMHDNESIFEPCPRDGGCKVIQDFLEDENVKDHKHFNDNINKFFDEEVDEWEIIKNQYDLAFKDKKKLLIIREFAEQQLRDVDYDLTAVNINISILDDRYRKYRDDALINKDFK